MTLIEQRIVGRERDLGGLTVRRVMPAPALRMLGPFVFLDHIGPVDLPPGPHVDVRPHPHIALATLTYLFSGEILHRDSLGSHQQIRPGDVNWMVAGRGIVHSERSTPAALRAGMRLHGLQSWLALPDDHEDDPPSFAHHPAATLPPDASLELPAEHEQRGIYVAVGELWLDGEPGAVRAGELAVLRPETTVRVRARHESRAMLIGGRAFERPREIEWNFVASTRERIEQAKRDWRQRNVARFQLVPGDEQEFIPLPGD